MASSKHTVAATAGLATVVGGAAFIAGASSNSKQHAALRASAAQVRVQQASSSSSAGTAASLGVFAAASAAAVSAGRVRRAGATAVHAFEGELGVQAPVGFWDPVGYTRDGNVETFKRRRETEIKHGRVAMYATIGYIVPEYFKWPGYLSPSMGLKFEDVPNGLAAISKVPGNGWAQIVAFAGYYELFVYKYDGKPGDYGWKAITSSDPETLKRKLSAEIANGRLAMMAIIGMFFQDGLTGSAWGDWSLYTDSPLRAFENELGVQAPLGFWDPLGFTKDGDVESFKRRREVEIKNGRVAMFATIGYIVPEYFKFPGYLAPSANLKFVDVPNGLGAFEKVPAEGWVQWVALCGLYETCVNIPVDPNEPGNYGKGKLGYGNMVLGIEGKSIEDPEARKRGLNSELANGRLAMMAITGMWFQDGLTGSAWGDWALYTDSPLRAFEGELGVQAPVGFWDPLGLAADGDVSNFKRRRAVELKHGRICMLACVGYIVPEYFRWPGYLSPDQGIKFTDVPHGIGAISKVPLEGWLQIGLFLGHYEGYFFRQDPKRAPGDFEGYGFLGVGKNFIFNFDPIIFKDEETRKKKLAAEIANGRLAMVALMAMLFQNGTVGTTGPEMWLPPSTAFENELGVQPPVGFWDPAGFTAEGNQYEFYRRRCIELKHGRVSMLACTGYIVQEFVRFPGFLSPSSNIKFADIPNGLAAVEKVPAVGWFQYTVFCGICDLWLCHQVQSNPPGKLTTRLFGESITNYEYGSIGLPGYLGGKPVADPELKKKKLNAELANGRLAMMAIIGMFFQDGLTGSAWGDWANYTDSPLRASAQDILAGTGGPFPENYWDPAGISKNKTEEEILELRAIELKHGRVAMLAMLGWFHVAAGWHFIGDYAIGERTSDNPLIAITQMPMGSVWQVVFTLMCVEWLTTYVCVPPKDKPWDVLGWSEIIADEEAPSWKQAQAQELNNGRLAMLAFVGMVAGDLATGEYGAGIGKPCFGYCMDFADAANYWGGIDQTKFSGPYEHPPLMTGFW